MTYPELTIDEIVRISGNYYDRQYRDRDKSIREFGEMHNDLKASLYSVKQPMYNQGAFDSVIKSIELNGITSFNMTTFWGKISAAFERNFNNTEDMPIHKLTMHYEECSAGKNALDSFTNKFNCDSVGCIAGFAMAEAVNWKQPEWLTEDSRNYMDAFESIACAFLHIPFEVGSKIFYGEEASVWAFVRYHEPENYGSLEWSNTDDFDIHDNYYENDWTCEGIALESISYKEAADVLRRIANGEILIDSSNDFIPRYSNEAKRRLIKNV